VARRDTCEIVQNIVATKLAAIRRRALPRHCVDLEPAFGDIQSDSANLLHVDGLLFQPIIIVRHPWHNDAV